MTKPSVAVIGGGIIGLSTAWELMRAGADVRCFEKEAVGAAQSKGRTRIFRHAHGDPRLVDLAMRSGRKWRSLEEGFRRRLLGNEGMIVSGDVIVPLWDRAMAEASAPRRLVGREECRRLLPVSRPPDCAALFDPAAGSTRVRRTLDLLQSDLGDRVQIAEVLDMEWGGQGTAIRTAHDFWWCDEVVIAAGVDSPKLAAQVGLDIPVVTVQDCRFTFDVRPEHRGATLACWIDESGALPGLRAYSQPVGNTGQYAIGVGREGMRCTLDVAPETVRRDCLEAAREYVPQVFPGLNPEPVDEIRCIYDELDFILENGDGFTALRRDHVTVLYGRNLFKFGPLLGELLKNTVMKGEVPDELRMFQPPARTTA
jgi:sarcosine oxidase